MDSTAGSVVSAAHDTGRWVGELMGDRAKKAFLIDGSFIGYKRRGILVLTVWCVPRKKKKKYPPIG